MFRLPRNRYDASGLAGWLLSVLLVAVVAWSVLPPPPVHAASAADLRRDANAALKKLYAGRHEKARNPPTGIDVTNTESASLVLDNGRLHGWCLDFAAAGAPMPLEVLDGNEVVWSGFTGQPDRPGGRCEIHVELPAALLDGRPHALQVRAREPAKLIAHFAEILPYTLTPEDALRRWGGQHLRSYLFPAARLRYESLRQKVQQLAARSAADKRRRSRTQDSSRQACASCISRPTLMSAIGC